MRSHFPPTIVDTKPNEGPIDPFERSGSVVEAVGQNVDSRIVPIDELSIHPDVLGGLHGQIVPQIEERDLSARKGFQPIRVAVSGSMVSPPLFESLEILGRDETLARIRAARSALS